MPSPFFSVERDALLSGTSLGPYRMRSPLGSGGFAPVWQAEEIHDGRKLRDVAVKLFALPEALAPGSPEAERWRAVIIAEASALCRVEHANVVRFLALQRDDLGTHVGLVMELVGGQSLRERIEADGRLPIRAVIDAGIDVAWALSAVHAAGLVHRDVKPGNIVLGARGHTLIDFGIVAPLGAALRGPSAPDPPSAEISFDAPTSPHAATMEASERTSDSVVALAGTPGFVAPECLVAGGPSGSPGADLYALGVTLFALAAGVRPDQLDEVATRPIARGAVLGTAPRLERAIEERSPEVAGLSEVITSLLIADPARRARHADGVARALERIRDAAAAGPRATVTAPLPREAASILDLPSPAVLAPFFERARTADPITDPASAARLAGELALAVIRFAVAAGLASLARAGTRASPALIEALGEARPGAVPWCRLARAVASELARAGNTDASALAFLGGTPCGDALGALLRSGHAGLDHALARLAEAFAPARTILAVAPPPSPWLPLVGGASMLPEAPRAPGSPWRATDPRTGDRHDAPALDLALRQLGGEDAEVEAPRSIALRPPPFIGRSAERAILARLAEAAFTGRAGFAWITGPLGIGRTRLVDVAIDAARIAPSRVLRFTCSPERRGPLRPLVRALEAAAPGGPFGSIGDAVDRALSAGDRATEALEGIEDAILWTAADEPLIVAADDVQWADAHTLGVLRLLLERAAAGATGKLLVIVAARDEPTPSPELRRLRNAVRHGLRSSVRHLALDPLAADDAARLVRALGPIAPSVEGAVVRGAGGVPFLILHALAAWREAGAIVPRAGVLMPAAPLPLPDVPGVAELLDARLDALFDPASAAGKLALRTLAAVALYGGGLRAEVLVTVVGDDDAAFEVVEALVDAGILTAAGDGPEHGFAQEMVRQAALNLVRRRPWFRRLSRALLDALAARDGDLADAGFLAEGYERLGERATARRFRLRALEAATDAGLFEDAAEHAVRLAALVESEAERAAATLDGVAALVRGRRFREARRRLAAMFTLPRSVADVRRRILLLRIVNGQGQRGTDDATLVADTDALDDPALACEARLALAGVQEAGPARALLDVAVERAERAGPALELTARVHRFDLTYGTDHCDLALAERDLTRALALSPGVAPAWQRLHLEGSLVVVEAELGRLADAITRLRALLAEVEARGMQSYVRLYHLNLAAFLFRAGEHAEAAEVAGRTHRFAETTGDALLQASALSIRAAALGATGAHEEALRCADEAEHLQRERGDRLQALTLLRRATILDATGREDDARRDADEAHRVASREKDADLVISAEVWSALQRARRDPRAHTALEQTITDAGRSGVLLRGFSRLVIEQGKALLASSRDG